MASTTCFRQVNEKHLQAQIAFMTWSPRMDLLAMASYQSQVSSLCHLCCHARNIC